MESNLQQNFNVGFTNMKSDVLVHLTQWQYWWWFWFSLLWAFYYLMILKMVRFRSLKFRPRIATTLRPHGKWGDLIVCIIPVSWCANIITNSNFILRMIEWQSESGLLTVRIRGKQWYWVYKFELKTFTDVFTIPKNIGHNKWQISTPNDLQVADDYLHILQLRSQNRWVKSYWEELSKEMNKSKNFHMISPVDYFINNSFDIYFKIVNGRIESSFNNLSELNINGVNYVFNRYDVCKHLQFLINMTNLGLEKEVEVLIENSSKIETESSEVFGDSETAFLKKYSLSEDDVINLKQIFVENHLSQRDLSYYYKYIENRNVLPSWLSKYASGEDIDIFSENDDVFYEILNIVSRFQLNTNFVNFGLIYNLTEFFKKFLLSKTENSVEIDSISKSFGKTEEDYLNWIKMLEELKKSTTQSDVMELFFNFNNSHNIDSVLDSENDDIFTIQDFEKSYNSDFTFNVENTFDDKMWMDYNNYSDLLVRLTNKKSNWDESGFIDSLDERSKFFLSDDSLFSSRTEESDSVDSTFSRFIDDFDSENYFHDSQLNFTYSDFNEFDRNSRKSQGTPSPLRLIKYPISNKSNFDLSSDVVELFRFRFNENEASVEHRLTPNSAFLIIRQKRYKRRKVILPRTIFYKDEEGNYTKRVKSSNYTFLSQNSIILENDFNATKRYKFFKKNKSRDELTNLVLSKRMLRTRRTLVLPAHLNITAITNSFDVVHSWFIPGLGLKMDAVPGRATHHTFYIDNVGFYYGQCAEICGRYHHHMPIRICALPFEHFLLWWQSFGLPKLLFNRNFRRYTYSYGSRKYAW